MTNVLNSWNLHMFSQNPKEKNKSYTITVDDIANDPNGFNYETILVLKEASEGKNLSRKYQSLDEMYKDMGL